jgi:hypothetical protein
MSSTSKRSFGTLLQSALLWLLALTIMFAAIVYQRRTGPTYPKRGVIQVEQQDHRYKLVRSEYSNKDARVLLPAAEGKISATLHYKRFKTDDPYSSIELVPVDQLLDAEEAADHEGSQVALLPRQPAAGKLEYYLTVITPTGESRIPAEADEQIVIRFKDPVPGAVLWPHVFMMFFAVLFGMRAGISAIGDVWTMRRHAWISLAGMSLGGMVLGPIVQKYAFGAYWTGFPWGMDLTDNKMLIMWLSWIFACSVIGFKPQKKETVNRIVVIIAALVMSAVYLIPHSMRGSELDYSKLEEGVPVHDAIGTSEH